jgi:hypothetical protein
MAIRFEKEVVQALRRLGARQEACRVARKYYTGDHPMEYGKAEFRASIKQLFAGFRYNLCPIPIDVLSDRLQLTSMQEGNEAAAQWQETARKVRLDAFQGRVHREALLCGVCHVLAWEVKGKGLRWYLQAAHLFELAFADADSETPVAGVKAWIDEKKRFRLSVYYADRVERFLFKDSNTQLTDLENLNGIRVFADDEPSIQNHPFGVVPAVRFANKDGQSELTDLIPLQNALNKSMLDMLLTSEAYGIPQRYVLGMAIDRDPLTGLEKNPIPKGGGVWVFEGEEIKVGQLAAADVAAISKSIGDNEERFARVAGLPIHFIRMGGDVPSGEALRVAESRISAKARGRTVEFGNSWEDLSRISWRTPDAQLDALWAPVETVSEAERLDAAQKKKSVGIPEAQVWREMGYTEKQIAEFEAANEAKRAKEMERSLRTFAAGQSGF